jgi:hypothetical protein
MVFCLPSVHKVFHRWVWAQKIVSYVRSGFSRSSSGHAASKPTPIRAGEANSFVKLGNAGGKAGGGQNGGGIELRGLNGEIIHLESVK